MFLTLSLLPYLARQSVDAKPLFGWILPRNPCKTEHGSDAQTRVFPRSKDTPTLKSAGAPEEGWVTDRKWSNGQRSVAYLPMVVSLPLCRPLPSTAAIISGVTAVVR